MVRFWVIAIVAVVVFTIYAMVDCALFDRSRIRGLPRGWWIVVILLVPIIGGLLWFLVGRGRPLRFGRSGGGRRTNAPDDDPEFLRRLRDDAEHEERIRRLEQELAELDSDAPADGGRGDDTLGTDRRRPDGTENPGSPGEPGGSGRPNA
ncbi:PLD nuclease N-terminal domain-containing protein [Agromyces arachidis]|uniref:PLD nuclease N-terminal domain-containing protein n=1 Tax=Agromyces arachidis TaxID=766966 RepID=UPI0040569701